MPRPNDSPDVAASKTLAYLLRHGAEKEGLHMRSDGYIKLSDVLARPKMRGIDVEMVLRLVAENAKQRFELFYGYDPSPPRPKVKKGEGKRKKGPKPGKDTNGIGASGVKGEESVDGAGAPDIPGTVAPSDPTRDGPSEPLSSHTSQRVDAATLDDIQHDLAKSSLDTPVELPLVNLPVPEGSSPPSNPSASPPSVGTTEPNAVPSTSTGEYFIRATQGHSLKVNHERHLESVNDNEDGRRKVGEMVHGTKWELYETIKSDGLSRMSRQHVHLAPALSDHPILPRNGSTLLIYLDLEKVLAAGIPVYVASNGVVLTPGNSEGKVTMDLWRKVEKVERGQRDVVWENGKA